MTMRLQSTSAKLFCGVIGFVALQVAANEDYPIVWGTYSVQGIEQYPSLVVEGQEFELHIVGYRVAGGSGLARPQPDERYTVTIEGNSIELDFANFQDSCISPVPPGFYPTASQRKILSVPGLPAGTYSVTTSIDAYCSSSGQSERQVTVYPKEESLLFNSESPGEMQIVSGIGVIRGWACYEKADAYGPATGSIIGRIAYQVDTGLLNEVPYGGSRTDTEVVCGENNVGTGYGAVTYWGQYSEGEHSFTLYIDGEAVHTNTFSVAAPKAGFQTGLMDERVIEDFPEMGQSVVIRWSEADQNFIIVEFN